jgi:flagella basal body P-ring formation protein FlgA
MWLGLLFSLSCLGLLGQAWASEPSPAPKSAVGVDIQAETLPDLTSQLTSWVSQLFERSGQSVNVEQQGTWGMRPDWLPSVHAEVTTQTRTRAGWLVTVSLATAGVSANAKADTQVRFKVTELSTAWVSSVPLRKGDSIACTQLKQVQRAMRPGHTTWRGDCERLGNMQMRHALQPGDVLMDSDVAPEAAVQAQQVATVTSRLGNIEIQAKGIALADAQIGQRVPIRLNGQTQVIMAVVTAPGQVRVWEGM